MSRETRIDLIELVAACVFLVVVFTMPSDPSTVFVAAMAVYVGIRVGLSLARLLWPR